MSAYFYVIEWHDGSGKSSGLVEASNAHDALEEVHKFTLREIKTTMYGSTGVMQSAGDIITFNKVDD